jgi:hypothetical protein
MLEAFLEAVSVGVVSICAAKLLGLASVFPGRLEKTSWWILCRWITGCIFKTWENPSPCSINAGKAFKKNLTFNFRLKQEHSEIDTSTF